MLPFEPCQDRSALECIEFEREDVLLAWLLAMLPPSPSSEAEWACALQLLALLAAVPRLRPMLCGENLMRRLAWCLANGDAELFVLAVEVVRMLLAAPGAERRHILERLRKQGGISSSLGFVATAAAAHTSAVVLSDVLWILQLALQAPTCQLDVLAARLPARLRSIETSRGLSGLESRAAAHLLMALSLYRTVLGADHSGVRRRP